MNLQTQVKTNVIVFTDGSNKFITKEIADKIVKITITPQLKVEGITIGNNYIKLTQIAKLLTTEEFYEQYPDKRSDPRLNYLGDNYYQGDGKKLKYNRINALKGMIKGLQEYIDSRQYKGTDKPLELMKKIKLKLTEAKADDTISSKEITQIYFN